MSEFIEIPVDVFTNRDGCIVSGATMRKSDMPELMAELVKHLKRKNVSEPFAEIVENQEKLSEEPLWVMMDRGSYQDLIKERDELKAELKKQKPEKIEKMDGAYATITDELIDAVNWLLGRE